jgi:hypothetical protein
MEIEKIRYFMKEAKIELRYGEIDFRKLALKLKKDETDFEIDDYRFINQSVIDKTMVEELKDDPYFLGCGFQPWFIAEHTSFSSQLIEIIQKAEEFEALGKLILKTADMPLLVECYAEEDGYGNYFASYDGETIEILNYYIFKIN